MARITVIPLWKDRRFSAGDSGTSDPIDLRYCANNGYFSIFHKVSPGTFGSSGTTTFVYKGCATENGIYVQPVAAGTIGTSSTAGTTGTGVMSFYPELMPWMKIIVKQSGTGTAGADSVVTAELIIQ